MSPTSIIEGTIKQYQQLFQEEPLIVRSPGRVNIIGEHTDYNDGFVLPASIDKAIYIAISKREDDKIIIYSKEFSEKHEVLLNGLKPSQEYHWANYILGVPNELITRGFSIGGFNLVLDGDIPMGAGLSSSAAIECAVAFGLNHLYNLNIDRVTLAEISQKVEHSFAGVLCGIMDQFASLLGKADNVIKLDCRSLEYEYVPLELGDYKIVLLNTNVKHSLATSEYNTRRLQCSEGVAIVKEFLPEVNSLRDITIPMLDSYVHPRDKLIYKRCKYVIEENTRLLQACEDLRHGNLQAMGKQLYLSHQGLSKQYEVSCPELDFLVQYVKSNKGVLGARMMGGGFGGCTINIVHEDAIEGLINDTGNAYLNQMGKDLTAYIVRTGNGTSIIHP